MKKSKDFSKFGPVSDRAWKQQIQADLRGGDYNAMLTWLSPEGITVKPFYTSEDLPGGGSVTSGVTPGSWRTGYAMRIQPGWEELAREALENGAEELLIRCEPGWESAHELLNGLQATKWLEVPRLDQGTLGSILTSELPAAHYLTDPIGNLAATGNWAGGMEADMALLGELGSADRVPASVAIHAETYQNAGANRVQELAYSLAQAHEYLLRAETDTRLQALIERPVFIVAVGNDYFFEIAKLRALRHLWKLLGKTFGNSGECTIIARPTLRNKTLYDFNTNMLRTTMECMAAVLGGADLVCNMPYDQLYHLPNSFAGRIARNQLLLLKHESYFDRVSNPADGAYYIESLTDQLGKKALEQFKALEKGGGLLTQLKEHKIQKKIRESARAEQDAFDQGRLVLVGSNRYPNPEDRMSETIQTDPFPAVRKEKTLIEPLTVRRLSEQYERKRLRDEQ